MGFLVVGNILPVKSAQLPSDSTTSRVVHFRFDRSAVEGNYLNNATTLLELDRFLETKDILSQLDSIVIVGSSSPDGRTAYNAALARKRAVAMKTRLLQKYEAIDATKIKIHSTAEDWVELRRFVESDPNVPFRNKVLATIDQRVNLESKEWRMKQIGGGTAWRYLINHFFRYLRAGTCYVYYTPLVEPEQPIEVAPTATEEPKTLEVIAEVTPEVVEEVEVPVEIPVELPSLNSTRKPLLALKTNLLFDVATLLNIEVEVPIGNQWSVAGEWIFPWWLWEQKQNCIQMLSGNLEGRYWFGNRENRPVMSGWFAGLYAGGGYYDLEWKRKGYQGEFFVAMGLSGGYAHTINKSKTFRMEYALGIGYMQTNYTSYDAEVSTVDQEWKLIRSGSGKYSWFGPTRAKVSLVWMLNRKTKEGGAN